MPASYPSSIHSFSTLTDGVDDVLAAHQNDRALEITAIETEIGVNPKTITEATAPAASPASVAEYLDMVATAIKAFKGTAAHWYTALTGTPSATTFLRGDGTWNAPAWGGITGTLSGQTDLQTVLDTKDNYNSLINGGFFLAQRQVPGTLTTYAANTYSADRWKAYSENASYQYARQDGLGETGLTSQYFGAWKKITNTGKMFIYQILEGRESVGLRGKTVIFQCQMKASASKTIRMGIFELQTAGTIDTVPSPIVTAAGANTVDPTMGTNVAVITAAASKSVTTSMQTFSVSVTVPATSKNIICAVWTDSQFAANDILYIAEAGLYVSSSVQTWKPRHSGLEIPLCQRYFFTTPDGSGAYGETGGWNSASSTTRTICIIEFPVEMRVAPTFTTTGNFRVDDANAATAVTSITDTGSPTKQRTALFADVAAGLTQFRPYKLSANNDTTARLFFDAEL